MEKVREVVRWKYLRIACIVAGVIGAIMVIQVLSLYSSASSLMKMDSDYVFSGINAVDKIVNGLKSLNTMHELNLLFLIGLVVALVLKFKAEDVKFNSVPILFICSLVSALLFSMVFAGVKSDISDFSILSYSETDITNNLSQIVFLFIFIVIFEISGAVSAYRKMKGLDSEVSGTSGFLNRSSKGNSADEQKILDYLNARKIDISLGLQDQDTKYLMNLLNLDDTFDDQTVRNQIQKLNYKASKELQEFAMKLNINNNNVEKATNTQQSNPLDI